MPPRRRSQVNDQVEVIIEQNKIVSSYLSNQYFDMCKATNAEQTCAICLDNVLDCKRCFCLLVCGHAFHSTCYLMNGDICPICRE